MATICPAVAARAGLFLGPGIYNSNDFISFSEPSAKQANNVEAERRACEIRLRAERKTGDLLKQIEKAKGARGSGSNQYRQVPSDKSRAANGEDGQPSAKTLRDYGFQKLADVLGRPPKSIFSTCSEGGKIDFRGSPLAKMRRPDFSPRPASSRRQG